MIKDFDKTSMAHKDILEAATLDKTDTDYGIKFDLNESNDLLKKIFESEYNKPRFKDDNFAILFRNNLSSQIDLIDLETYRKTAINFSVSDLTNHCGCCKICDNKYLVYGGFGNVYLSSAKIIDIKTKSVESLPSDSPNCTGALCLFNKEVYCFGGSIGSGPINICKKIDLKKSMV